MTDLKGLPRGLSGVSLPDLESLAKSLDEGELSGPITAAALQSRGLGHLAHDLEPYAELERGALLAVLEAVFAERHYRSAPKLTLVWTGDDPGIGHSRYTRIVLPELFQNAREHVLIAGYSFDAGEALFGPLHESMSSHGTSATFFVDIHQLVDRLKDTAKVAGKDWGLLSSPLSAATSTDSRGQAAVTLFYKLMWPFGCISTHVRQRPSTPLACMPSVWSSTTACH